MEHVVNLKVLIALFSGVFLFPYLLHLTIRNNGLSNVFAHRNSISRKWFGTVSSAIPESENRREIVILKLFKYDIFIWGRIEIISFDGKRELPSGWHVKVFGRFRNNILSLITKNKYTTFHGTLTLQLNTKKDSLIGYGAFQDPRNHVNAVNIHLTNIKSAFVPSFNKQMNAPKNIDEAIEMINELFDESTDDLIMMDEEEFKASFHFGVGGYLRAEWCLWWFEGHPHHLWPKEKPQIVQFFNDLGIYHADDMSSILMVSFFRYLKGEPIKINEQVESYIRYWKERRT